MSSETINPRPTEFGFLTEFLAPSQGQMNSRPVAPWPGASSGCQHDDVMLQHLPITYKGELHDVRLVNFSVHPDELVPLVPDPLQPLIHNDRGLISLVDVHLKNMRPHFAPKQVGFDYHHLAFRLLIDDRHLNGGDHKGLYFLHSFSDSPMAVWAGNQASRFRFLRAKVHHSLDACEFTRGDSFLHYALDLKERGPQRLDVYDAVHPLDRSYAVERGKVYRTRVIRDHWPIEPVECYHFETNFFRSARLESAFQVKRPIDYTWTAPELVPAALWARERNQQPYELSA